MSINSDMRAHTRRAAGAPFASAPRPAVPNVIPRRGLLAARRDTLQRNLATGVSAFAAVLAVLVVAAGAVVFALG